MRRAGLRSSRRSLVIRLHSSVIGACRVSGLNRGGKDRSSAQERALLIGQLCAHQGEGFDRSEIHDLLEVTLHDDLDVNLRLRLLSITAPNDSIALASVQSLLAYVGRRGKRSTNNIKISLLEWLSKYVHFLRDEDLLKVIQSYYPFLFKLLSVPYLRCAVAGLLCRVFRPSHVTDSRVAKLRAAYAESNTPQISLCRLLQLYTSGKTSKSSENTKVCEKSRPIKSRKLTAKTSTVDDTELLGFFSKDFQEDPEDILVIIDHLQHALNQKYLRKLQAQLLRLLLSSSESRWSANLRAKPRVEDLGFACHATNGLVPGLEEELRLFARLYDGSTNTQEAFSIFALLLSEGNHESIRGTIQKLLRTYIFAAPDSKAGFVRMLTELIVRVAEKPPGPGEADGRQQIIQHIVKSMEGFLLVSLMVENDSIILQNASLRFYESVSTIFLNSAAPQVPLPCTALLNRLFFGSSGMSLSRITSVVADYKELYETFGNIGTINGLEADAHLRDLDQLNSYIMDICDFVWRNKAFINNHPLSKSFGMSRLASEALVKDAANNHVEICRLYNLAFAPSLLSFAAEYAKLCRAQLGLAIDHAPVTAKVISSLPDPTMHYQDWRVYLLEFLKERGFTGFYYFMFSSLRSLVEFRDNRVSSTGTSPGNSLG